MNVKFSNYKMTKYNLRGPYRCSECFQMNCPTKDVLKCDMCVTEPPTEENVPTESHWLIDIVTQWKRLTLSQL
jgi:hypothetical protein